MLEAFGQVGLENGSDRATDKTDEQAQSPNCREQGRDEEQPRHTLTDLWPSLLSSHEGEPATGRVTHQHTPAAL